MATLLTSVLGSWRAPPLADPKRGGAGAIKSRRKPIESCRKHSRPQLSDLRAGTTSATSRRRPAPSSRGSLLHFPVDPTVAHWSCKTSGPMTLKKSGSPPRAGGPMTLKISGLGWPHHPAKIARLMAPSGCKPAVGFSDGQWCLPKAAKPPTPAA